MPLTLKQATVNSHLHQRVQDSTGKSGSVSFRVTAPFPWVLVCTRFCCALQESVSPVLWKFCNQIPLAFKVKFPGGSQSFASLVAQRLKHLPAMRENWVQSLGWEDPLGKEMATHSNILAWEIPCTEESGML